MADAEGPRDLRAAGGEARKSVTEIITVTANPTIDVSTSIPHIEPFTKLRCAHARKDPGGGGINVARVVKRLGGDVAAVHPAGGVNGRLLIQLLDREGVPSRAVATVEETREDFTVLEEQTLNQFRFVLPGPRLSEGEWQSCMDLVTSAAPRAKWVVASGSLPPSVPHDSFAHLARAVKEAGARFAIDTAGAPLKAAVAEGVHLIKPNMNEFEELTGVDAVDEARLVEACDRLIADKRAEMVALSLGPDGAVLVTADEALISPGLPIVPQSVVGAGDSFMGALVWCLARGKPRSEALRYAVAAGSAALLRAGTELSRLEDVTRLVKDVTVRSIKPSGERRVV